MRYTVKVISLTGEEVASHDRTTWADALISARAKILKAAPGAEPTTVIYADGKVLAGFRWDSLVRQIVHYLGPVEPHQS